MNRERLVSGNEMYIFGAYIDLAIPLTGTFDVDVSELRTLHSIHRAV